MKWVTCCSEEKSCRKIPCIALIDDSINIDKFNECFYSTIRVNWRLATKSETTFPKCLTCESSIDSKQIKDKIKLISDHIDMCKYEFLTEEKYEILKNRLNELIQKPNK